jgi:hypothetical protein
MLLKRHLNEDFHEYVRYVKRAYPGNASAYDTRFESQLKNFHKFAFTMKLWSTSDLELDARSQIFLLEAASDAIHVSLFVSLGAQRPTQFLMRAVVENIMRHLYFHDHPIEFHKNILNNTERPTVKALFDYASSHPVLIPYMLKHDAVANLHGHYSELCKGVHASSISDMSLCSHIDEVKPSLQMATKNAKIALNIFREVNYILLAFHRERTGNLNDETYWLLISSLLAKAKRAYFSV